MQQTCRYVIVGTGAAEDHGPGIPARKPSSNTATGLTEVIERVAVTVQQDPIEASPAVYHKS